MFKSTVVDGKRKYLILDLHKKGKTVDEYKMEIARSFMDSFFGEIYDFIPKDLSEEEKIKMIKGGD